MAEQYTPLAKRYAKIGVDLEAVVVHTGKDLHPERKRLNTLAFYKASKKSAEFFDSWPADSDSPTDRLFGGSLEEIEKALATTPTTLRRGRGIFGQDYSKKTLGGRTFSTSFVTVVRLKMTAE